MLTLVTQDVQNNSFKFFLNMSYYYIYFTIMAIGLIVGIVRIKSLNKGSKLMLLLLFLTIISESLATFLKFDAQNNVMMYHIFEPIEFFLICFAFWNEIKHKAIFLMVIGNIIFALINSFFIQHYLTSFNSNAYALESFLSILLALWYLYRLLSEKTSFNFTNYPMFWISVGFMIFNVINLFILGTHNAIANVYPQIGFIFRTVRFVSNYLLYILFIVAFISPQKELNDSK